MCKFSRKRNFLNFFQLFIMLKMLVVTKILYVVEYGASNGA